MYVPWWSEHPPTECHPSAVRVRPSVASRPPAGILRWGGGGGGGHGPGGGARAHPPALLRQTPAGALVRTTLFFTIQIQFINDGKHTCPPPRGAPTGAAGAGGEARWTTPHGDRKRRSPGGPAPGSPLRRGSCGPVRLRGSRPVPVGGGTGGAWGVKRFETHGCYFVMVEEYPGGRGYTGWLHGRGRGGAPWGPGTGSRGTCSVWAPEERQTLAKRKGPGAGRRKRGAREAAWGACRRRGRTDGCGGERGRKTDGRKGCVDGSVWVVRGGASRWCPPSPHQSPFAVSEGVGIAGGRHGRPPPPAADDVCGALRGGGGAGAPRPGGGAHPGPHRRRRGSRRRRRPRPAVSAPPPASRNPEGGG